MCVDVVTGRTVAATDPVANVIVYGVAHVVVGNADVAMWHVVGVAIDQCWCCEWCTTGWLLTNSTMMLLVGV